MSQSPGHRRWPDHHIAARAAGGRVRAELGGEVRADSLDALVLEEDRHPPRYYFPRQDVRMGLLEPSRTTSECPFKGTASYFDLKLGERLLPDAVWSYEHPYDEHLVLTGRIAFYDDKYPEIEVRPGS